MSASQELVSFINYYLPSHLSFDQLIRTDDESAKIPDDLMRIRILEEHVGDYYTGYVGIYFDPEYRSSHSLLYYTTPWLVDRDKGSLERQMNIQRALNDILYSPEAHLFSVFLEGEELRFSHFNLNDRKESTPLTEEELQRYGYASLVGARLDFMRKARPDLLPDWIAPLILNSPCIPALDCIVDDPRLPDSAFEEIPKRLAVLFLRFERVLQKATANTIQRFPNLHGESVLGVPIDAIPNVLRHWLYSPRIPSEATLQILEWLKDEAFGSKSNMSLNSRGHVSLVIEEILMGLPHGLVTDIAVKGDGILSTKAAKVLKEKI